MRTYVAVCAAALIVCPCLIDSLRAQQQEQGQPRPRVNEQVGVPEGRAGGAGRQGGARQGGPGRQSGPARPVPRTANGHVLFGGATTTEKGVWLPGAGGAQSATEGVAIPFQPWARAVLSDREKNQLEPHTRCKPSGVARQFLTPYGVEIVEMPELERVYIFDIGGPHTYRTVYMDGRSHPKNLEPSFYGHSIGWWEGDTLAIDTVGYNEAFWLDRRGTPHTEKLHTLERFTRTDFATIKYELTVDDPGAYTSTWKSAFNLRWEPDTELFEYVCQQQNYAPLLMLGSHESVDRSSPIVP